MPDLEDVPLDAPIPTSWALYAWSEQDGVWLTWPAWIFRTVKLSRDKPAANERSAAPSPLFDLEFEEVS